MERLLAEAGYPGGIDLTLNSPDGRYLRDKEVGDAAAGQLTRADFAPGSAPSSGSPT